MTDQWHRHRAVLSWVSQNDELERTMAQNSPLMVRCNIVRFSIRCSFYVKDIRMAPVDDNTSKRAVSDLQMSATPEQTSSTIIAYFLLFRHCINLMLDQRDTAVWRLSSSDYQKH